MNKNIFLLLLITFICCKPIENIKDKEKSIVYKTETNITNSVVNGFSFSLNGEWKSINTINNIAPINPHCIGIKDVFGNEIEITIYPFQGLEKNVNHNISIWKDKNISYSLLKSSDNYKIFEVNNNKILQLKLFGINNTSNIYITHFNKEISTEKNILFIENIFEQIKK